MIRTIYFWVCPIFLPHFLSTQENKEKQSEGNKKKTKLWDIGRDRTRKVEIY